MHGLATKRMLWALHYFTYYLIFDSNDKNVLKKSPFTGATKPITFTQITKATHHSVSEP